MRPRIPPRGASDVNCSNCGAPLTPVAGRDYFRCGHCETCEFPEPLADSADGIVPLGEPSELPCPVCSEPLARGTIEGYEVAYCEKCRGVLANHSDFPQILRARQSHCGPAQDPAPLDPEELSRQIDCPACGRRMETHPFSGGGNAVVDTCASCWLIWLDSGEIAALAAAAASKAQLPASMELEPTLFSRFGPRHLDGSYGPDGLFLS